MAVEDGILPFMRIKEWPNSCNKLVLNVHIEHQYRAQKQMHEAGSQQVWQGDIEKHLQKHRKA
eukprot:11647430-Karenia_brevis.AAC.1